MTLAMAIALTGGAFVALSIIGAFVQDEARSWNGSQQWARSATVSIVIATTLLILAVWVQFAAA